MRPSRTAVARGYNVKVKTSPPCQLANTTCVQEECGETTPRSQDSHRGRMAVLSGQQSTLQAQGGADADAQVQDPSSASLRKVRVRLLPSSSCQVSLGGH